MVIEVLGSSSCVERSCFASFLNSDSLDPERIPLDSTPSVHARTTVYPTVNFLPTRTVLQVLRTVPQVVARKRARNSARMFGHVCTFRQ